MNEELKPGIPIEVNHREYRVDVDTQISYEQLCQLANLNPAEGVRIAYVAGSCRAGLISAGEFAPLNRGAVYQIPKTL